MDIGHVQMLQPASSHSKVTCLNVDFDESLACPDHAFIEDDTLQLECLCDIFLLLLSRFQFWTSGPRSTPPKI